MEKVQVSSGAIITILFLAGAVYLYSLPMLKAAINANESPAQYGMLGQMILSISQVNVIDASNAGLPWAGKTWLITLTTNPQDAESIIAKTGYLEDTIPKEQIASNGMQAQYDLKIKFTPVTQQCIYGPDITTWDHHVPVKVLYKDWDLGSGLTCPHSGDWQQSYVEPYKQQLLDTYDDVAYGCTYFCGSGVPKHAYLVCYFTVYKQSPSIGISKMTLKSLYTQDRIDVTAGYKTASGTTTDSITTGSENPTALLKYGSEVVGKVDFVGYLQAKDFCPEGSNYYLFNNGQGWKIVPETLYDQYQNIFSKLDYGQMPAPACDNPQSWDAFNNCKTELSNYIARANDVLNTLNSQQPIIDGKQATKPADIKYSADNYFAIKPDAPVAYGMYRMYLKASWVGILISTAKPQITSITPTSITLTGPESKQVSVLVKNVGDEGGIITKVSCTNGFKVDGLDQSSRSATFEPNESKSFTFTITYGGSGTSPASATCTVVAQSSASPNIKATGTFTVQFKPKGVYPPNTTVCISSTAYARTDASGNIVPGTEHSCPQNSYCEDTPNGAQCKEQIQPPTNGGSTSNTTGEAVLSPMTLVAIIGGIIVLIILILAVAL